MIENEDLRDKLFLITEEKGFEIQQQSYLPFVNLEEIIDRICTKDEFIEAKVLVIGNIFSLRKENRHLLKRLEVYEKQDALNQM